MVSEYEKVYTVTDYWDQPRAGVANFHGIPHSYAAEFDDEVDDWSSICLLRPIDAETFALVMESWAIWRRWQDAFHGGTTTMETYPALPDDRERTATLKEMMVGRLKVDPVEAIRAVADFQFVSRDKLSPSRCDWLVRWTPVNTNPGPVSTVT